MTNMTNLFERNEQFARTYTPAALGLPAQQVLIVTCLDHRTDPAIVLGLQLGDAPVIRNAGGRVTQAVIDDIAFLGFLAGQLSGGQGADGALFEVAVIHHTQCGTGFLADPGFRRQAAQATSLSEAALEACAVADPHVTIKADVERLLASPVLPPGVSVSGHVYDIATGHFTTTHEARRPRPKIRALWRIGRRFPAPFFPEGLFLPQDPHPARPLYADMPQTHFFETLTSRAITVRDHWRDIRQPGLRNTSDLREI